MRGALARGLLVGAVIWPGLLGAALAHRIGHAPPERSAWPAMVYLAAAQVCHQQPERSFHTGGERWPVCARCAGLYLAAPLGMVGFLALTRGDRRGRMAPGPWPARACAVAAVPTVLTVLWEWGGLGTPANGVRWLTALPLGAAIGWILLVVTHRVD